MEPGTNGRFCCTKLLFCVKDNLGFLNCNLIRTSEDLSVPLDHFIKHRLWSYPYVAFSVHSLIYDHLLEGFRMFCYVKDTLDVALEMSVVFSCHIMQV